MPSLANKHNRTMTWPPRSVYDESNGFLRGPDSPGSEVDEDPYSHFISPVTDEDDPNDALSLSAGIISPEQELDDSDDDLMETDLQTSRLRACFAKRWERYVMRNHEQLHSIYHQQNNQLATWRPETPEPMLIPDNDSMPSPPASPEYEPSLLNISYRLGMHEPPRKAGHEKSQTPEIQISPPTSTRRRSDYLTQSGRRHSWRKPSVELFTVTEEEADISTQKRFNTDMPRSQKDSLDTTLSAEELLAETPLLDPDLDVSGELELLKLGLSSSPTSSSSPKISRPTFDTMALAAAYPLSGYASQNSRP